MFFESFVFNPSYDVDGNVTSVQTSTGAWAVEYNSENCPVRWTNAAARPLVFRCTPNSLNLFYAFDRNKRNSAGDFYC